MTVSDYHTIKEAAKVIGCSRVWVWKLIQAKKIPAEKVGGVWLIKPSDLRTYLKETA